MAMTKVKNLQLWCKKMADGYRDVEIRDMAASWKTGLAFCAIIHRFRPDLIDYDSLSKENVFENNNLAFEVAEKELSIPAFLEAADMVAIRIPDRLSVVTYVSQYYNYFHNKPQLGGPGVNKFVTPSKRNDKSSESPALQPVQNKNKMNKDRQISMGDKCSICHEKVYLMERQIENTKLYHRRCFRNSELSPTSKVLKRQPYDVAANKEDSQSTKIRKLETDTEKDKTDRFTGISKEKTVDKSHENRGERFGVSSNFSAVKSDDFPREKNVKNENKCENETKELNKKTEENKSLFDISLKPTKTKPSNLVNKFKELDKQNLESLSARESSPNKLRFQKTDSGLGEVNKVEKNFPVPKPRHNLVKTFEKMDSSESVINPIPSPRNQPSIMEIEHKSMPQKKLDELSKPNTPSKMRKDYSTSPPPPLPLSSPPKLNISGGLSESTSKNFPARLDTKQAEAPFSVGPVKPPRMIDNVDKDKKTFKPMDVSNPVLSKSTEAPSVKYQKEDEQKDKQVLGGLLKSLANVRQNKDTGKPEIKARPTDIDKTAINSKHKQLIDSHEVSKLDFRIKPNLDDKKASKTVEKPRPKTSFISQSRELFLDDSTNTRETKGKSIFETKKTTNVINKDSKISDKGVNGSYVSQIGDKVKINESDLGIKHTVDQKTKGNTRAKTVDEVNSSSEGLLDWQKEAEKRKELRKGGYVDPEKYTSRDEKKQTTNELSDTRKIKLLVDKQHKDMNPVIRKNIFDNKTEKVDVGNKKKIELAQRFVFENIVLKPTSGKPQQSTDSTVGSISPKTAPPRPPLPKTSHLSPSKHHISTYQIQKQLRIIDDKLTQLELKGRTLEDSIRKANDQKEDELMISWFELINDKNELVRRECDLVYISKNQELELEQEKIELQLRQLVDKPAHLMTESDVEKQMRMLEKKVELVYQRNKIVDSIDEDRLRYLEEDEEIKQMLQEKGFLKEEKEIKVQKNKKKKGS